MATAVTRIKGQVVCLEYDWGNEKRVPSKRSVIDLLSYSCMLL
jgi:hypothetical protein